MFDKIWVLLAALCSVVVALLHVYVIVEGPWAYRFFGAGEELATLAEQGSWLPTLLTSGIVVVFLVFAAYYLAAGGWLRPLPWLRWGVIGIAAIYTLRGALVFPALLVGVTISSFDLWSSLVSLLIGLIHCVAAWRTARPAAQVSVGG